ncbi:MAG: response regulator [Armatimonadota bacterium]|jgi:putative two-component system response regulator
MSQRILLVDDDPDVSQALGDYLGSHGFECVLASSAEEGLRRAIASPPDAAVVDVVLPEATGIDMLTALRALRGDMPVLLMTGHADLQTAVEAVRLSADDYLLKPFAPAELCDRLAEALDRRGVGPAVEAASDASPAGTLEEWRILVRSVEAICNALEAKDEYTRGHSQRVARTAQLLGLEMGLTGREIETIRIEASLHDIGKIGVPEIVLSKPMPLTEMEWKQMRGHPEIGFRILSPLIEKPRVLAPVRHHHERMDGLGYPDGLPGDDIGLSSRIIAVADGYDGMMSARAYRPRRSRSYIIKELETGAGTQWDTDVVEALFQSVADSNTWTSETR